MGKIGQNAKSIFSKESLAATGRLPFRTSRSTFTHFTYLDYSPLCNLIFEQVTLTSSAATADDIRRRFERTLATHARVDIRLPSLPGSIKNLPITIDLKKIKAVPTLTVSKQAKHGRKVSFTIRIMGRNARFYNFYADFNKTSVNKQINKANRRENCQILKKRNLN